MNRAAWVFPWALVGAMWLGARFLDSASVDQAIAHLDAGDADAALTALRAPSGEPAPARLVAMAAAHQGRQEPAKALAALRAAWERAPYRSDIVHNLTLARDGFPDALPPVGPARAWTPLLTPGAAGLISIAVLAAGSGWLAMSRRVTAQALALWLAGIVSTAFVLDGRQQTLAHPIAVVVEPATLRDAPDPADPVRRTLPVGSELRVAQRTVDFALVRTGADQEGWVPIDALAIPDPRGL